MQTLKISRVTKLGPWDEKEAITGAGVVKEWVNTGLMYPTGDLKQMWNKMFNDMTAWLA